MSNNPRLSGLEWLRFLLSFFVMIYHTAHRYPQLERFGWLKDVTSMGFFATSTFFVLSGFLLTHVYFDHDQMREPARRFWAKRFSNLYPLHIVALLSSVVVLMIMHWLSIPPDGPGASPRFVIYDTHEIVAAPELLQHYMNNDELVVNGLLQIFMLQAWNPLYLTFNAPLWSLSTLFFFYLVYPWVAPRLMAVKHIKLAITVVCLISLLPPLYVIYHAYWGIPWTGLLQRFPPFRVPEFVCGILCYGLFRLHQQEGYRPGKLRCFLLSLFIVSCFISATWLYTQRPERYWYPLLHNGLLLPSQMTLIYLCALLPGPRRYWLQRCLPRLGASSLSIFALHVPLFYLWTTFEPVFRGMLYDWQGGWGGWVHKAGNTTLSLSGYAVFLMLTVWVCIQVQEQFVTKVKDKILKYFI